MLKTRAAREREEAQRPDLIAASKTPRHSEAFLRLVVNVFHSRDFGVRKQLSCISDDGSFASPFPALLTVEYVYRIFAACRGSLIETDTVRYQSR